jgi:hypothetical protein
LDVKEHGCITFSDSGISAQEPRSIFYCHAVRMNCEIVLPVDVMAGDSECVIHGESSRLINVLRNLPRRVGCGIAIVEGLVRRGDGTPVAINHSDESSAELWSGD